MSTNSTTLVARSLAEVPAGKCFRIKKVHGHGEIRQRLIDLGFIKNEVGTVIREALLKDPIEVELKGTHFSLRRSEARLIEVEVID
ncbi:MAG: ferrous iron transport protein A [Candidatus Marinimicrobia bacterium]|jgi:Fe2+ transport system protein FeoA|nr:ferrous iron transport protein A [Candidatus Neomarinimicrobiota bacterium]NLA23106.1 ferrous iron transport protein A [Candidatus Neomarinimicrobiota bacterium]HNZ36185.1 ferrous iron transport protein A [Candidatus Neomarinimicrobiota bacterium]HOD38550.1 ferrous iron transport protein A [Candidatus Neomarinimicrobiota bacterium]HOG74638.1 ferrous iron transport protein A [Candidatus Neomarinimicrobiota bacterium]